MHDKRPLIPSKQTLLRSPPVGATTAHTTFSLCKA